MKNRIANNRLLSFTWIALLSCSMLLFSACESSGGNGNGAKKSKDTSAQKEADKKNDHLIIPGERFGLIKKDMSEADLIELFGAKNVKRDSLHLGEGMFALGTRIFGAKAEEVRVLWKDGAEFKQIARVTVDHRQSPYQTIQGVKIGTLLAKVVQVNKVDFTIWGFDWDYGGTVAGWEGGELGEPAGFSAVFSYDTDISKIPQQEFAKVVGDEPVSTSEPILKDMNVRISKIFAYF